MVHFYTVTLTGCKSPQPPHLLESVDFVARSPHASDKYWSLTSFQTAQVFGEMFSPKEISEIVTELNFGQSVTLPGNFGPTELTALGYRLKFEA